MIGHLRSQPGGLALFPIHPHAMFLVWERIFLFCYLFLRSKWLSEQSTAKLWQSRSKKKTIWSRKRKILSKKRRAYSFVLEDSNFFQVLSYIFSAFKRHNINHATLRFSPVVFTVLGNQAVCIQKIYGSFTDNSRQSPSTLTKYSKKLTYLSADS